MGKTQSKPTGTQLTINKHTSKMHETLLKCNENAMHEHITSNQQHLTQQFHKNLKKTKKMSKNPKPRSKMHECMLMKGLRTHTK